MWSKILDFQLFGIRLNLFRKDRVVKFCSLQSDEWFERAVNSKGLLPFKKHFSQNGNVIYLNGKVGKIPTFETVVRAKNVKSYSRTKIEIGGMKGYEPNFWLCKN